MMRLALASLLLGAQVPPHLLPPSSVQDQESIARFLDDDLEASLALDYFTGCDTCLVALSPDGSLAAVHGFGMREDVLVETLEVVDLRTWARHMLNEGPQGQIRGVTWSGDRTLLVEMLHQGLPQLAVVRLDEADGGLVPRACATLSDGYLVHALPDHPDEIVYAYPSYFGSDEYHVSRIDIGDCDSFHVQRSMFKREYVLFGAARYWLADSRGNVRAAGTIEDGVEVLWVSDGPGNELHEALRMEAGRSIEAVGFTADERRLVVFSDEGRQTKAAFELDPATGRLGKVLFEHPEVDVEAPIWGADGALLGFSYTVAGRRRHHLLVPALIEEQEKLALAFRGKTVRVLDYDRERRRYLLVVSSATDPGTFYLHDREAGTTTELFPSSSQLRKLPLYEPEVFALKAADGMPLEAIFTRPPELTGKAPLVVMPHGGPIAVRDTADFDPAVQFLASRGFAILQVNYRGSGGLGRTVREAGKRQWGRGIEDDIDTAVDALVARGAVDPERIAIAGASYGGYSALMSVIRRPDRYRCGASLAGPTDLPLLFTSSDWASSRPVVETMKEYLGDPNRDLAELVAASPLYQHERITRPIQVAHGTEDRRVSIEHALRLRTVMGDAHPLVEWVFYDAGHGFATAGGNAHYYLQLARFLGRHLGVDQSSWKAKVLKGGEAR